MNKLVAMSAILISVSLAFGIYLILIQPSAINLPIVNASVPNSTITLHVNDEIARWNRSGYYVYQDSICYYAGKRWDVGQYALIFNVVGAGGTGYGSFTFYSYVGDTFHLYDKTYKVSAIFGDTIILDVV